MVGCSDSFTAVVTAERSTTRFIIFSDTDGFALAPDRNLLVKNQSHDVAIHCGNMTLESKLREFEYVGFKPHSG